MSRKITISCSRCHASYDISITQADLYLGRRHPCDSGQHGVYVRRGRDSEWSSRMYTLYSLWKGALNATPERRVPNAVKAVQYARSFHIDDDRMFTSFQRALAKLHPQDKMHRVPFLHWVEQAEQFIDEQVADELEGLLAANVNQPDEDPELQCEIPPWLD